MTKYTSKYLSLGFYVEGELKRFSNGTFATDDKATIMVLDGLADVKRDEQTKQPEAEKPAPKAPARKSSAK